MDLPSYVAALARRPSAADARDLAAAPPAGVRAAVVDEAAAVAVLTAEPGVLRASFDGLGAATAAPPVPSSLGPLAVAVLGGEAGTAVVYGDPHVVAVAVRWPAVPSDLDLDSRTGRITGGGRGVGRGTSRFAADALGGRWRDLRNGFAWLDLEQPGPGGTWLVGLSFEGEGLGSARLAFVGDGEPRDWASWSREADEASRERHHAWLRERLGRPRGDEWRFGWGSVWAGVDARDGGASVVVRYA
jgi:hypothetical protein